MKCVVKVDMFSGEIMLNYYFGIVWVVMVVLFLEDVEWVLNMKFMVEEWVYFNNSFMLLFLDGLVKIIFVLDDGC